jgi:acyl carrier protein
MSEQAAIREAVTTFIADEFDLNPAEYGPDTRLFSSGLLDSFALTIVIMFIEERFGVRPASTDLESQSLDSVDAIARWVDERRRLGNGQWSNG